MGVNRIGTVGIHIKLLKVQGILPFLDIVGRDKVRASLDGEVSSLPAMVLCIFQSVFNNLLICCSGGTYIKIVIVALVPRLGS